MHAYISKLCMYYEFHYYSMNCDQISHQAVYLPNYTEMLEIIFQNPDVTYIPARYCEDQVQVYYKLIVWVDLYTSVLV